MDAGTNLDMVEHDLFVDVISLCSQTQSYMTPLQAGKVADLHHRSMHDNTLQQLHNLNVVILLHGSSQAAQGYKVMNLVVF
jgi:hypothetical protein